MVASVIAASGGEVPEWMLRLPKKRKRDLRPLMREHVMEIEGGRSNKKGGGRRQHKDPPKY